MESQNPFQLLEEKGIEWARRNEELQRELRQALRTSIYDTERETASVNTLEQVKIQLNNAIKLARFVVFCNLCTSAPSFFDFCSIDTFWEFMLC